MPAQVDGDRLGSGADVMNSPRRCLGRAARRVFLWGYRLRKCDGGIGLDVGEKGEIAGGTGVNRREIK